MNLVLWGFANVLFMCSKKKKKKKKSFWFYTHLLFLQSRLIGQVEDLNLSTEVIDL